MYLIFGGISAGPFFSVVHGNRDRLGYGRSRFDPGLRSSLFLMEILSKKDQKLSKCLRNDSDPFTTGKFLRRDLQPRTLGWKLYTCTVQDSRPRKLRYLFNDTYLLRLNKVASPPGPTKVEENVEALI